VPKKLGSGHASATPYQAFRTADGWILIAAANQNLWEKLGAALKVPHLVQDARFKDNPSRMAHLKEFLAELNAVIGKWKTLELEQHLVKAGVPCSKLNTVDQLLEDGQVNALDPFNEMDDPDYGHFKVPGAPIHLLGMAKPTMRRPPRLGEHTRQVLEEIGYDRGRVDGLIKRGAVADGPPAKGAAAD